MDDNRRMPRTKKRLSCTVLVSNQSYTGIVLDVSATGIFVQTSAAPKPGEPVHVDLQMPGGEILPLEATVARRRKVPARLKSIAQGGVGLCLDAPPEAYFSMIGDLQAPRSKEPAKPEKPAKTLKQTPTSGLARKALLKRLEKLRSETG